MRYRVVYQQEPLITIYWYCEYMMQVGAILRVRVPDISKDTKHRVEVLGADGKYTSAPCTMRQVPARTGITHIVVEDRSGVKQWNIE